MLKLAVISLTFIVACLGLDPSERVYHPKLRSTSKVALEELDAPFWQAKAQTILEGKLGRQPNTNIAKNVIMFMGDGMSIPTLAAARSLLGERNGHTSGEGIPLSFEQFPYSGLSQTYCIDYKVADSACSSTAYLRGVKGNKGTIGVTARVALDDCKAMTNKANHVHSIAKWFQDQGLATGLVTTARVTHASPAGVYAHTANRDWESDKDVMDSKEDPKQCPDIAQQLVDNLAGKNLNVVLGGGRRGFLPENMSGDRQDGQNLINKWLQTRNGTSVYVAKRDELLAITETPTYLLGLFAKSHLEDHFNNDPEEPTLEEMTVSALKVLQNTGKGYFLFVEGAKIDMGHHDNEAQVALDEAIELAKAVTTAKSMVSEEDTLIVVTADHAHTMSFSGYTPRDKSILDFAGDGDDDLPYLALSYANGPGFQLKKDGRYDLSDDLTDKDKYVFPAAVPLSSETHGGDDVAVFANGPWAHLFTGSYEQNFIPHGMAFAACVGSGKTACSNTGQERSVQPKK